MRMVQTLHTCDLPLLQANGLTCHCNRYLVDTIVFPILSKVRVLAARLSTQDYRGLKVDAALNLQRGRADSIVNLVPRIEMRVKTWLNLLAWKYT